MIEQIMNLHEYRYRSDTQSSFHLSPPLPPVPQQLSSPLDTPSSSGPYQTLFLPDTPLSSPFPPLSPPYTPSSPSPLLLPDTPSSGPFIFSAGVPPPPLSPSPGPFIFPASVPPPLSPSPLLLPPDTPSSSPFTFSAGVTPPLSPSPLLQSGTPSPSGPFIFPASVPPPLSPSPPWGQLLPQSRPRLRPRRRRRRNEEELRSGQVTSLGQSTLTETQIWEALDKLKNQVYTGAACAICLEYFVPKEEVSVTPCNHMFHEECLVSWVMRKGQCPCCRFVLFESTRNQ